MTRDIQQQKKIKVLAYCDSPTCATGFGTVSRNILSGLYATGKYDIDVLGINFWGDPHNFPFRIWPTAINNDRDPYGRKKVFDMIPQMDFDILFFLQDTFILEFLPDLHNRLRKGGKQFRSICYFPIDGPPKEQWLLNVNVCDVPVVYSEYGKAEAVKIIPSMENILTVPHGVNTSEYFVSGEKDRLAFRSQFFGSKADNFIFTNLNRNQQRKDIPRTIAAFYEFKKQVPNSTLYLHMAKQDQGWDLPEVVKAYNMDITSDVIFPENFGPNQGFPRQVVNMVYNASDCILSTTLGEGWGLSWLEAMATKTPIIMPANTAIVENITKDRGWLVDCGTNPSLFTVVPNDNEVVRPLVDVESMVKTMLEIYNNPAEAKRRAENAYAWVHTNMTWENSIVPKWLEIFNSAYNSLQKGESISTKLTANTIDAETF